MLCRPAFWVGFCFGVNLHKYIFNYFWLGTFGHGVRFIQKIVQENHNISSCAGLIEACLAIEINQRHVDIIDQVECGVTACDTFIPCVGYFTSLA